MGAFQIHPALERNKAAYTTCISQTKYLSVFIIKNSRHLNRRQSVMP